MNKTRVITEEEAVVARDERLRLQREQAIGDLSYYWRERGDITRLSDYRELLSLFPHLERAYTDLEFHTKVFELALRAARDEHGG